jgi:hypothetical protein
MNSIMAMLGFDFLLWNIYFFSIGYNKVKGSDSP